MTSPAAVKRVPTEGNLAWLDLSYTVGLTPDGKTLLFTELSGSMGVNYATCLRQTDGSPVVRLGEGNAALTREQLLERLDALLKKLTAEEEKDKKEGPGDRKVNRVDVVINAHEELPARIVRELVLELQKPGRREMIKQKFTGVSEARP